MAHLEKTSHKFSKRALSCHPDTQIQLLILLYIRLRVSRVTDQPSSRNLILQINFYFSLTVFFYFFIKLKLDTFKDTQRFLLNWVMISKGEGGVLFL